MQKEQIGVYSKAFDVLVKKKSILRAEDKSIFEGLEKAIGETITERIKKLDLSKKRCVLLTGKDGDLIRGVACYIYYHYKREHEAFYYMDYLLEREFIKREGFKYRWTKKDYTCEVLKDGVLFVENLITDDTELQNTLAAKTRNIMAGSRAGMLIVSTKDAKDAGAFSAYFRSQFVVINLKPTTQKTPAKDINLFHDYYQRILFLNNETYYKLTPKEQTLVEYLKSGERDIKDICHEMWGNREKRNNFDNLMCDLNKNIKEEFGIELVRNMEKGEGMYRIEARITEKDFKSKIK